MPVFRTRFLKLLIPIIAVFLTACTTPESNLPKTACACANSFFGGVSLITQAGGNQVLSPASENSEEVKKLDRNLRKLVEHCKPIMQAEKCDTSMLDYMRKFNVFLWDYNELAGELYGVN